MEKLPLLIQLLLEQASENTKKGIDIKILKEEGIVVIGGVEDRGDLFTAIQFELIPIAPVGHATDGLLSAVSELSWVWNELDPKRSYIFAGYSFGGAIAALLAWRWYEMGNAVESVITIGTPKCFDRTFVYHFDAELGNRTYRIALKGDVVPNLPLLGHRNVGELIGLNDDAGSFREFLASFTLPKKWVFLANILTIVASFLLLLPPVRKFVFQNHSLDRYKKALEVL